MVFGSKDKVVLIQERIAFRQEGIPSSTTQLRIERIPPMCRSTVTQLQIWFGLRAVPIDANLLEAHLVATDLDNPPDIVGLRNRAEWSGAQNWRAVGTPATMVQTLAHENLMLVHSGYETVELGVRSAVNAWIIAVSDTAVSQLYTGTLAVVHALLIRTWGGDSMTFDTVTAADIDLDTQDEDG